MFFFSSIRFYLVFIHLDVEATVEKLKIKIEKQDEAIKNIHNDMRKNNLIVNLIDSVDES